MKTAIINGKPMNAYEIADYIEHTTGEPITADAVRDRMRKGWTGEALVSPAKKTPQYTVTIDGEVMGPFELSDWLRDTRGYEVGASTLRARMGKGETGERLLRPSRQKQANARHGKWGSELVRVSVPGWGVRT